MAKNQRQLPYLNAPKSNEFSGNNSAYIDWIKLKAT